MFYGDSQEKKKKKGKGPFTWTLQFSWPLTFLTRATAVCHYLTNSMTDPIDIGPHHLTNFSRKKLTPQLWAGPPTHAYLTCICCSLARRRPPAPARDAFDLMGLFILTTDLITDDGYWGISTVRLGGNLEDYCPRLLVETGKGRQFWEIICRISRERERERLIMQC